MTYWTAKEQQQTAYDRCERHGQEDHRIGKLTETQICGNNTYDLCPSCYAARTFCHHHSVFLDSFVLLRNKRGLSHGTMSHTQPPLRPNAPALAPSRPCPPATGHGGNMPLMHHAPLAVGMANEAVGAGTLISQGADANGNAAGFADATNIVNADNGHAVDVASNCPMM
ncbi:hypothetical protein FEM48_Zijuj07G0089600 [Ziziphus jujuba var. spinosa]|uniref:Uncharacterized protein n=1 Tax=Ziziphus jujuba var. spinosa TaxID=714518 RepID=A0A978V3P9_ZIZJJ|nr:hypothetical protein FEM48_Zijuj07G0089600 [Ziziphus jujuba var. spinosa]